jgi:hypothetical protein
MGDAVLGGADNGDFIDPEWLTGFLHFLARFPPPRLLLAPVDGTVRVWSSPN